MNSKDNYCIHKKGKIYRTIIISLKNFSWIQNEAFYNLYRLLLTLDKLIYIKSENCNYHIGIKYTHIIFGLISTCVWNWKCKKALMLLFWYYIYIYIYIYIYHLFCNTMNVYSIIVLSHKKVLQTVKYDIQNWEAFPKLWSKVSVLHSRNSYFVSSKQNFCEIEKLLKGRGQTNWIYFFALHKKSSFLRYEKAQIFIDIFKNSAYIENKLHNW